MPYKKLYDPPPAPLEENPLPPEEGQIYVYDDKVVLAINVALATKRPLLVRGPVGSGKSTLARHVARQQGWKFYDKTITSQTKALDLLWSFDAVRRLADAQLKSQLNQKLPDDITYIEPGPLWWAYDPGSAGDIPGAEDPAILFEQPPTGPPHSGLEPRPVVLLDEIDKADPDEPDNLLDILGSGHFQVGHIDKKVCASSNPFVVLTSNDVRQLSAAFRRRCVILDLRQQNQEGLIRIAAAHFGQRHEELYRAIADKILAVRESLDEDRPGTAEYLDAVRACIELKIDTTSTEWQLLQQVVLAKTRQEMEL